MNIMMFSMYFSKSYLLSGIFIRKLKLWEKQVKGFFWGGGSYLTGYIFKIFDLTIASCKYPKK